MRIQEQYGTSCESELQFQVNMKKDKDKLAAEAGRITRKMMKDR